MKGRRTEWCEPCPKCGESMEYFDDEDNGAFGGLCMNCGHEDKRDYYKDDQDNYVLMTKKQALERNLVSECTQCGELVYKGESENGKCIFCNAN